MALEHLLRGDFDLVLCALSFDDWSGAKLYSMAAKGHSEVARRFAFVASEAQIGVEVPPSRRSRVLSRPVNVDEVRKLIARVRRTRSQRALLRAAFCPGLQGPDRRAVAVPSRPRRGAAA